MPVVCQFLHNGHPHKEEGAISHFGLFRDIRQWDMDIQYPVLTLMYKPLVKWRQNRPRFGMPSNLYWCSGRCGIFGQA